MKIQEEQSAFVLVVLLRDKTTIAKVVFTNPTS